MEHPEYKAQVAERSKIDAQSMPSEVVELPSRGLCYKEESFLSKGEVSMRYMNASDEEILMSQAFIKKGTAIDKLIKNLIVDNFEYSDLLVGDKDQLMLASRIFGYGKEYTVTKLECPDCGHVHKTYSIDLSEIDSKKIDEDRLNRDNEYSCVLPSGTNVKFRLLTVKLEKDIADELKSIDRINEKVGKNSENQIDSEFTTRLKYMIIEVNGDRTVQTITKFSKNMLAIDTRELRKQLKLITPGPDMTFNFVCKNCDYNEYMKIPMTVNFFWPDSGV